MASNGQTPEEQAQPSGKRTPRVKQYDTSGSRSIDELDPNSSHAKAYALIPPGSRVLDLGCGSGELASYLAARGDRVWGVDVNPAALALAAPFCAATRVADLETAELADLFPGQRFDVVVFADVLEHVREPWSLLQSARGVIETDGHVVASIPNFAHAAVRLAVVSGAMPYRGLGILDGTHVRFFTLNGVMSLFEESGFRLQAIERTTLPFDQPSDLVPDVRLLRVPREIERHVREDAENETLQFVVRAVMLPGAWDMGALRDRLHDVEARGEERAIGMRNFQREVAAARALADERAAQIAALEHDRAMASESVRSELLPMIAQARGDMLAAMAERDDAVVARASEVAARRRVDAELAMAQAALQQAIIERDEARAQQERRNAAMRHELEGARRELAELGLVRERARALAEERARLETVAAEAERRAAALQEANERASEREAHAAATLASADATRAALESALAHAEHALRRAAAQRDERNAAARTAEAALARYVADARDTEDTLRARLQSALDELETLRARARHDALRWMLGKHAEAGTHDDGAQFWSDELAYATTSNENPSNTTGSVS